MLWIYPGGRLKREDEGEFKYACLNVHGFEVYYNIDDFERDVYRLDRHFIHARDDEKKFYIYRKKNVRENMAMIAVTFKSTPEEQVRAANGINPHYENVLVLDCSLIQQYPDAVYEKWYIMFDLIGLMLPDVNEESDDEDDPEESNK